MPYDPTKPVEDSPLDATEMRDQLNGLKALIDGMPNFTTIDDAINSGTANNIATFEPFGGTFSNPPTQAQVQELADKLNELIAALQR